MQTIILTAYVSTIRAGFFSATVARIFDAQPGTYAGNRNGCEYVAMCRAVGTGERQSVTHAVELFRTYIRAMIRAGCARSGGADSVDAYAIDIRQGHPAPCDVEYVDDINRHPLTIAQGNAIARATVARSETAERMRARDVAERATGAVAPVRALRPVPSVPVAPFADDVVIVAMSLFAPRNRDGRPYVAASQS